MRLVIAILLLICTPMLGACSLGVLEAMADTMEVISLLPKGSASGEDEPEPRLISAGPDQTITSGAGPQTPVDRKIAQGQCKEHDDETVEAFRSTQPGRRVTTGPGRPRLRV